MVENLEQNIYLYLHVLYIKREDIKRVFNRSYIREIFKATINEKKC